MHIEIPVKVNAWIDEGVAPLVRALSQIDRVCTVDSCEQDADGRAYVYLQYRGTPDEQVLFFQRLAYHLAQHQNEVEYELLIEWLTGNEAPMCQLLTPRNLVNRIADSISNFSSDDHTSQ